MSALAPGLYSMGMEQYQSDPCLEPSISAGILHLLLTRTPRHAWLAHPRLNPRWSPESKQQFDLGDLSHTLLLGDERAVEIIVADDWRTKLAKEARDLARKEGRIPVLAYQHERAIRMVKVARAQLAQHEDGAHWFKRGTGEPEQTLIWQEGDDWARCRLDWSPHEGNLYPDFKTCAGSAGADEWGRRQLFDLGNDVRAAWYLRGIRAILRRPTPQYRFCVQELDEPHALNVMALSPSALEQAERKVDWALDTWRRCRARNFWPGYPKRTVWVDAPAWESQQFEDRAALQEYLRGEGTDLLALGMAFQAPL